MPVGAGQSVSERAARGGRVSGDARIAGTSAPHPAASFPYPVDEGSLVPGL